MIKNIKSKRRKKQVDTVNHYRLAKLPTWAIQAMTQFTNLDLCGYVCKIWLQVVYTQNRICKDLKTNKQVKNVKEKNAGVNMIRPYPYPSCSLYRQHIKKCFSPNFSNEWTYLYFLKYILKYKSLCFITAGENVFHAVRILTTAQLVQLNMLAKGNKCIQKLSGM